MLVWLPWAAVAVAFVLGLLAGGLAMRFWLLRAGPAIAPTASIEEPAPVPATPATAEFGAGPSPEPREAEPRYVHVPDDEFEGGGDEEAEEGDQPPDEDDSKLQAALKAHQDVLEKLESKYRNASAPAEEEPAPRPKRRRAAARGH